MFIGVDDSTQPPTVITWALAGRAKNMRKRAVTWRDATPGAKVYQVQGRVQYQVTVLFDAMYAEDRTVTWDHAAARYARENGRELE